MTNKELLAKLKNNKTLELYGGLREKAQKLKNRGFLIRDRFNSWTLTNEGEAYLKRQSHESETD